MYKLRNKVAILVALSCFLLGAPITVYAQEEYLGSTQTDVGMEASSRYVRFQNVSFNVNASSNPTQSGEFTVEGAPGQLSFRQCTSGEAKVTIYVDNVKQGSYVIPRQNNVQVNIPITCSVGSKISYIVSPYADGGYSSATGTFTIYY